MSNEVKTTHYELPTGAIAILEEILPTPTWYKDSPKQGKLLVHSIDALDALPDTAPRPIPPKGEEGSPEAVKVRDTWASVVLMFEWTDKQKEAVKTCAGYYLKQGSFMVTPSTIALIKLLGLDDE